MIDGGVFLGRNPANGLQLDEKSLLSFLNRHSIQKAIVTHYRALFYNYKKGNEELLRICKKFPDRLIPAAFVQPTGFDILKDKDYFKNLKKDGCKILSFITEPHYYEIHLESPLVHEIARMASAAGLLVQFAIRNNADLEKIMRTFADFKNPILIRWTSGRGYHTLSEIILAATQNPNFYFDCGSLTCSGAIEYLVHSIGADRLFFASGMPENFSYTSHMLLQTSGLKKQDLSMIYSGTLNKLLFKAKGMDFNLAAWEKLWAPLISFPKIDTHWHTDGWNILEPKKDYREIKQELSNFNIQKAVFSSIEALNYDFITGNQSLFDLAEKEASVYALIVVDPTRISESVAEIKKYANHPKCVGIKTIQDLYGFSLDCTNYEPLFAEAGRFDLSVMAHIPGMVEAARKHPKLRFVCAHATLERVKKMLGCANIWFDLATSHHDVSETKISTLFEKAGVDKILFASDGPLMSPAWTLGKLAALSLSSEFFEKIFRLNAIAAFPKLGAQSPVSIQKNKKATAHS